MRRSERLTAVRGQVVLPLVYLFRMRAETPGIILRLTPPGLGVPDGFHVPREGVLGSSRALVMRHNAIHRAYVCVRLRLLRRTSTV
jgi:hypothetical protein